MYNPYLDAEEIENYCNSRDLYYNYFGESVIIYKGDDTFQIDKVSDNEFLIYHVSTGSNRKGKFKAHLHRTTRDLPYALYNVIDTHNHYAF